MGEKNSDQIIMMPSSISLLQERFRQLQREKETREGKELLRSLMEYEKHNLSPKIDSFESYDYEPHKLFFKSEILKPSLPPGKPSPCHFTMSLWPDSQIINQTKVKGFYEARETMTWQAIFKPSVTSTAPLVEPGKNESDVDTSLHL